MLLIIQGHQYKTDSIDWVFNPNKSRLFESGSIWPPFPSNTPPSQYLDWGRSKASQLVYDANRLTGFLEMGNSIEGHFRGICKIIFFVNGMLLLLLVLHLALVFYICMVYLVFFTLYCFSILICADLVRKSFGCFDLRSVFVDTVPWVEETTQSR